VLERGQERAERMHPGHSGTATGRTPHGCAGSGE
jgi:hypothetical protein